MYEFFWMLLYDWHRWRQRRAVVALMVHENIVRGMQQVPPATAIHVRMRHEETEAS